MSLSVDLRAQVGKTPLKVSFEVGSETLALIGPNGAGKSSILSLILGLVTGAEGRLAIGERLVFDSATNLNLPVEHRRVGYVPQHYALFPHFSVLKNIAFAVSCSPRRLNAKAQQQRVDQMLHLLGLETLARRNVLTLSGGERQRVALARALGVEPLALLLDEPLAALDVHAHAEVRAVLRSTLASISIPTLIVTHDPQDVQQLASRVAVVEDGQVVQMGTWAELNQRPATRFAGDFVGTGR
jgi:molybdate transport system ATP-binding protein